MISDQWDRNPHRPILWVNLRRRNFVCFAHVFVSSTDQSEIDSRQWKNSWISISITDDGLRYRQARLRELAGRVAQWTEKRSCWSFTFDLSRTISAWKRHVSCSSFTTGQNNCDASCPTWKSSWIGGHWFEEKIETWQSLEWHSWQWATVGFHRSK